MNAKGVNIGGKNVKRLTLDGVVIFPLSALPAEYEPLEYITILCDKEHGYENFIMTTVRSRDVDEVEMTISLNPKALISLFETQMILGEYPRGEWVGLAQGNRLHNDPLWYSTPAVSGVVEIDGANRHIIFKPPFSTGGFLTTGYWTDSYWSYTHREYGFRYLKDGVALCDAVPCRRSADGVCGMYDLVSGTFMANAGSGGNAAIVAPDQRLTSNI